MREYAPPILKTLSKIQEDITLVLNLEVSGGLVGTNGLLIPVTFSTFGDSEVFPTLWKYFEIEGYRLSFNLATTTNARNSFNAATIAWYPVNNLIDATFSTVPATAEQVDKLEGSIFVQSDYKNVGKWFPNRCKQVYPSTAMTGGVTAGYLIAYVDDIGVLNEEIGHAKIEMNVRAYARRYTPLQV